MGTVEIKLIVSEEGVMNRTETPFFPSSAEKQFTDGQEVLHLRGWKVAADVDDAEVKFIFGPKLQEA